MTLASSATSYAAGDPYGPTHLNTKLDPIWASLSGLDASISALGSSAGAQAGTINAASSDYSGTWDQRVRSAISDLGSYGGTVDARGLSGAQTMTSTLTITKPGVTVWLGAMSLTMGSSRIVVAAGANGVKLIGNGAWGTLPALGMLGSSFLYYTGSACSGVVAIGDGSGTRTREIVVEDVGIHCTGAARGTDGIYLTNTIFAELNRLYIPMGSAQTGKRAIVLDGTGGATFAVTIRTPAITGGDVGIHFTGAGVAAANANLVLGGNYSSTTTIPSAGILFDADSNGNAVVGMDIENCASGISTKSTARYNFVFGRYESNTTDYTPASTSTANLMFAYGNKVLQGLRSQHTTVSANYTLALTDSVVRVASSSTATITVPSALSMDGGWLEVKRTGTAYVEIVSTSSQSFDSAITLGLTSAGSAVGIRSIGTGWIVMSRA